MSFAQKHNLFKILFSLFSVCIYTIYTKYIFYNIGISLLSYNLNFDKPLKCKQLKFFYIKNDVLNNERFFENIYPHNCQRHLLVNKISLNKINELSYIVLRKNIILLASI